MTTAAGFTSDPARRAGSHRTPHTGWPGSPGRAAAWLAKQTEIALCDVQLSLPQYRVLGLLAEGSAVSSVLADRLAVRPPSVTAIIDGLVARKLVRRRHGADDRRRISLVLTPDGGATLDAADAAVSGRLRAIAESLGDATRAERALDDLALWGEAIVAHHRATHPPTPDAAAGGRTTGRGAP